MPPAVWARSKLMTLVFFIIAADSCGESSTHRFGYQSESQYYLRVCLSVSVSVGSKIPCCRNCLARQIASHYLSKYFVVSAYGAIITSTQGALCDFGKTACTDTSEVSALGLGHSPVVYRHQVLMSTLAANHHIYG